MYFVFVVAVAVFVVLLAYAATATTRTQLTSIVLQISARRFVYLFHSIVSIPFPLGWASLWLVLIHIHIYIHSFNRQTLAKMCIEIWCSRCLNVDLRSVAGLFFLLLVFFPDLYLVCSIVSFRLNFTRFFSTVRMNVYFDFCFFILIHLLYANAIARWAYDWNLHQTLCYARKNQAHIHTVHTTK